MVAVAWWLMVTLLLTNLCTHILHVPIFMCIHILHWVLLSNCESVCVCVCVLNMPVFDIDHQGLFFTWNERVHKQNK